MANYAVLMGPKFQGRKADGSAAAGYKLFTYDVGTGTKKTTYSTKSGTANSNPVVLDDAGEADLYLDGNTDLVLAPDTDSDPPTSAIWGPITAWGFSDFALTILDDTTAGAVLTTLGITAFAQTLLDDATAAAVLTTLGFSTLGQNLRDDTTLAGFLTTLGVASNIRDLIAAADAAAARAVLDIGMAGSFSAPNAGRSFYSADDALAFVPGRVPLILAADEMVLIMPASITKTVTCAANTIYYAYVAQPASGLTIAAGDITVNTTAPTIQPTLGNRYMNAGGTQQFLGAWPTDATSDFCTGLRDAAGWAWLLESAGTVNTANGAWGDIVLPGCPLITGTLVVPWVPGAATSGIEFSLKGNADAVFVLFAINNTFKVYDATSPIYTYGDGKISAKSTVQAVSTLMYWEAR